MWANVTFIFSLILRLLLLYYYYVITILLPFNYSCIFPLSSFPTLSIYYFLFDLSFKCDVKVGGGRVYVASKKKKKSCLL